MDIRPIEEKDREPLAALIRKIETFSPQEVEVAIELVGEALKSGNTDYAIIVADRAGQLVGYVCYGPTPMTEDTYDLYWIASATEVRGQGVGAALVSGMEGDLRRRNGRLIRVETSATEAYGPTRGFYASMKYGEEARIRDFYKVGDDLIILTKRL
ncbi:GNAT family N-acetyltransferase [Myxococcus sp. MISCRS1]|jgi:ribosomal protein S18 acetylase RimI-like enzyme|uniref:N-acetyltransferase domain-containing protein n=1 Tax=Myxococcus fulvus TaxID=33 RepID=A0A511SYI5_MYXFU|nr:MULTISPECIES: GNAT family N-acetyltransferase [Myxococcus]BDT37057.1 GNAT family N-acetyltransferase [Myxococcus sp. MH1]MBZ4394403.1 GNAT family N-acetyltransferase [Myxococcus sp. AS-1-15]MBZ4410497.1 GNAT family N-acetyltransferase [Myxococcus sp. XM-1-1-1]MCK8496865.1 GNAT family N-acetyltransferase [Myxococcus fulvus]MCY1001373.1 GNAT family N-acetyltransferase [Myxococcus sp. MISCRS1]